LALINAGMKNMLDNAPLKIKNEQNRNYGSGFFADVKELKDWLEVVWGKAEEIGTGENEALNEEMMMNSIGGRDGVIIIKRNENFNYASLWEIDRMVAGDFNIGNAAYFWELKGVEEYARTGLRKIRGRSVNLAAIEGFKVISDLSRYRRREVCAAIYFERSDIGSPYRLAGPDIGSVTEVKPVGIEREMKGKRIIVAYIHTHVIEEEGAHFFSARDFNASYDRKVPVYMKHVNATSNRILKANNIWENSVVDNAITAYRSRFPDRFPMRDESFTEATEDDFFTKADDGCYNRELCFNIKDECTHIVSVDKGHCLFGIFKRHGQEVFEIDPNDGSEKPFH
jgi:hypothetical protein